MTAAPDAKGATITVTRDDLAGSTSLAVQAFASYVFFRPDLPGPVIRSVRTRIVARHFRLRRRAVRLFQRRPVGAAKSVRKKRPAVGHGQPIRVRRRLSVASDAAVQAVRPDGLERPGVDRRLQRIVRAVPPSI
jgi:hypothetical protein